MAKLKCDQCGEETEMPGHCGREMSIQDVDGDDMLVCWMGPRCGKQEIPQHCGESMVAAD